MATPRCPKCSKTHFTRSDFFHLKVSMIFCSHCGSVIGVAPLIFGRDRTGKETVATYND